MMRNIMEIVIVTADDIMSMLRGRDEEQVAMVIRSIAKWLAEMHKRPKPQRFLCLDCDTTFHDRRMPEAFAVTLPFAIEEGSQAVTTGICRRCVDKEAEALTQTFAERLRAYYYPDLTIIQRGHA
jgi:hypothetical protein